MTVAKYTNMGVATLNADITAIATSLDVASIAEANSFPSISESWDYFRMILTNKLGDYEIVKVTAKVGSTFTIERGMEGTTALAWVSGDRILGNATSALLEEMRNEGAGGEVIEKSADFTLTPEHANKTIQTTAGLVITMNPMIDFKDFSRIMIKNSSGNPITINPDGTETIDGDVSYILPTNYSVEIYKGTSGWELKTLSKTKLGSDSFRYIQGLACQYSDVDSIFITPGKCSSMDGSESFETTATMTADVNHDFNTGDGGLPLFVTKTGTFSSVGTAIVGTGTLFTTEFKVGDVLHSTSQAGAGNRTIVAILNDTQMVISTAYGVDVASDAVIKGFQAPFGTLHAFLMYNSTLDTYRVGFDTQTNHENLDVDTWCIANGFVPKRRIGSVVLNGALQLDAFSTVRQNDNVYTVYNTQPTVYTSTTLTAEINLNIGTPHGLQCEAILRPSLRTDAIHQTAAMYLSNHFSSPLVAPTRTNACISGFAGFDSDYAEASNIVSVIAYNGTVKLMTSINANYNIDYLGFIDYRN